jgi:preprotein translocase subunit SecA
MQPIVDEINEHYERLHSVSDDELRGQTARFRERIREATAGLEQRIAELKEQKRSSTEAQERERLDEELGGKDGTGGLEGELRDATAKVLDDLLPEAFATVREASRRLVGTRANVTGHEIEWNMIPYDVQLVGGYQLHHGRIAEMATGEGKTLVAALPLYLNALPGKGAHLITVNSYLARRDAQWIGHLYNYLGLTVGCIDDTEPGSPDRRAAYLCDITYGTNNEFGFDYLRDNMVISLEQRVQRRHVFAIVDEVDSVLIDEARTPLIISGPVGNDSDATYAEHNPAVARLARAQGDIVNSLVGDAERAFAENDNELGALLLYKAQLGGPKNKRLLKMLQEPGVKQLVQKTELQHIADRRLPPSKQQYRDIEDELLFVLDEKGHSVHLTDRGIDYIAPDDHEAFVLPDISHQVHLIDTDSTLSPAEKLERRATINADYALKAEKLHIIHQLLRAHSLYEIDVNYVVQEGEVLIVDEFTGRTMPGRRWSEGLHQAVEAKEHVHVKGETQTLATITIQNYFRMYDKLAGMTGTAETEETEFNEIYSLDVSVIPTNRPVIREDRHDLIYKTRREKYNAIVEETIRLHQLGFPVLVGTVNVEVSETLSKLFKRAGIPHNVLNAKYHQREAEIVASAGQYGAVTIATNMAGRGTDIKLGEGVLESKPSVVKNEKMEPVEVTEIGGLHIIGSERHESRRIDRQLRGRAGRQGDPGASQFFLSLEDDLMRLFGSERVAKVMDAMGVQEGEVLTHSLITRSIEQAQKRVELQNFQSRKRLLEYDDVMNQQREVIYSLRSFALDGGEELRGEAERMIERAVTSRVEKLLAEPREGEPLDIEMLRQELLMHYTLNVPSFATPGEWPTSVQAASTDAVAAALQAFNDKMTLVGAQAGELLAYVMLAVIDEKWKDHLYDLDQLRNAIYYRSWGQQDPLVEYKQEAYKMFVDLMDDIYHTFTERFARVQLVPAESFYYEPPPQPEKQQAKRYNALGILEDIFENGLPPSGEAEEMDIGPAEQPAPVNNVVEVKAEPVVVGMGKPRPLDRSAAPVHASPAPTPTDWTNVGRNDPCPCGSGKKFKKCHGAVIA